MRFGVFINMDEGFSRGLSSGGALFGVFAVAVSVFSAVLSAVSGALSGADFVELGLLVAFCALPFVHAIWSTGQFVRDRTFYRTHVAPKAPDAPVPLGRSRMRQDRSWAVYLLIRSVLNVLISALFFFGLGLWAGTIALWILVLDGALEVTTTVMLALGGGPLLSLVAFAAMLWATRGTWRIKLALAVVFALVLAIFFVGNSPTFMYRQIVQDTISGPDLL